MNPRVLFAEDDSSIRESFSAILRLEGVVVTACASARETCNRLASEPFDLVITDMRMETPTAGWQVLRAAAALSRPPRVAILSAFPIPKAELRGHRVDAVLSKGMPTQALLEKIRELIHKAAHSAQHHPRKDGGHDHAL